MIENEIRGKLNADDFKRLILLLGKNGKLLKNYKRLSVDLSPGFDQKSRTWSNGSNIDLRVKKSGSEEKITLKIGDFHKQKRREIEVRLPEGVLLNSLELLNSLGFKRGLVYFWENWEFEYLGCEIKLTQYRKDYFSWEIESKGKFDPNGLAVDLGLVPYTREEFRKVIDWQNQNIHQIYSQELVKQLLANFK